jgi:hypothetical protein
MFAVMSEVSAAAIAHTPDADALTEHELSLLGIMAAEPFNMTLFLEELMADAD